MSSTSISTTSPDASYWERINARLSSSLGAFPVTAAVVLICLIAYHSRALSSAWQLAIGGHQSPGTVSPFSTIWTSLTCHMTHWSFGQLFWDVLAFAVLGYLCERTGRLRYLCMLVTSGFAISCGVMVFHPQLDTYRGLSGIDSALFAYLACYVAEAGLRQRDRLWLLGGSAAWLVFVGKVTYELVSGQTLFVESAGDFQPLPVSHVAGALMGTLTWSIAWLANRTTHGCGSARC